MAKKKKKKPVERILNCIPSVGTHLDWLFEDAAEAKILATGQPIPASKDLREDWWKIGNQKSTGSCVGWSTADSVLRWHFVKAKRIKKNQRLSVRFIWMASKESDIFTSRPTTFIEKSGTSLKAALDIVRKYGVVFESTLPFATGKLYPKSAKEFYLLAAQRKITMYINLGTNPAKWREWLATEGPILTRLDVDDAWYKAKATNGNLDHYKKPNTPAGHAVALVGYTPDRFIVRNSWGNGWGDKGFGYASMAYAKKAFTEAYGVRL